MTAVVLKIYDFLSRHKWVSAAVATLLCGLAALACLSVSYQEDITKFLPQSKESEAYSALYRELAHQNRIAVLFYPSSDVEPQDREEVLAQTMDSFSEKVAPLAPQLGITIGDSSGEDQAQDIIDLVTEHYPIYLNAEDYRRIDSLLASPQYIDEQLEEDKRQLSLPQGGAMAPYIAQDPLGLFTPVMKRLEGLRPSTKLIVHDGHIFESDMRYGLLYITTGGNGVESRDNDKLVTLLDSSAMAVSSDKVQVSMIGGPNIAVTNARQLKHDSLVAFLIAITLIVAILIAHYRRVSEILWIVVAIAFGWFMAIAGMALFHDEVSMIVLGIGSTIIGIAVNYPLHYLDHLRDSNSRREALREMAEPLLIGNITTVGAFACLIFLDAEALRHLGVFGSLILIGTILFVLVFLPLFAPKRRNGSHGLRLSVKMWQLDSPTKRRWFITVLCLATVVLFIMSLRTSFDSNIQNINFMTEAQKRDLKEIASAVDQNSIYAVARGKTLAEAQKANEQLQRQLTTLSHKGLISVHGTGDFLPTAATQQERIAVWQRFWTPEKVESLTALLQRKSVEHGFNEGAFEPFYAMLGTAPQGCSDADVETLTSALSSSYILDMDGDTAIVSYVSVKAPMKDEGRRIKDEGQEDEIKALLRGSCDGCYIFGSNDVGNELVKMLSSNFNYIGFVCSAVVFVFLLICFGRIELCFVSFVPLAIGWIWILGLMQLLGVQFNIVNIILATFIFGQGDDYSIFITEGLIYERAYGKRRLHHYSSSVLVSALIMFIGIGALIVSRHPALRSLAIVTVIGMAVVVAMAYYLPPLLFRWLTTVDGEQRRMPITCKSFVISLGCLLFFSVMTVFVIKPLTWLFFLIKGNGDHSKDQYHRLLQRIALFVVNHLPGVKVNIAGLSPEKLAKPAVIICNHQSHLDLMCLMSLSPKIVIFTNRWTWNNPFYSNIIHRAEFLTVTDGYDSNLPKLRELVARGYSVAIFPEGTRSESGEILRFHKGAFLLAEQLGIDILPIYLHGASDVLNKREFMLQQGTITVALGERFSQEDEGLSTKDEGLGTKDEGLAARELTKFFHRHYRMQFEKMRDNIEDSNYWAMFLRHQYLYKGATIARRCRENLRQHANFSSIVDDPSNKTLKAVAFENCGQGEAPFLFALVNRHCQVYAITATQHDYRLLKAMAFLPQNLHICKTNEDISDINFDKTISLNTKCDPIA